MQLGETEPERQGGDEEDPAAHAKKAGEQARPHAEKGNHHVRRRHMSSRTATPTSRAAKP